MKTISVNNGKFNIPKEFVLSVNKRRLKVRTPWSSMVQTLCKDNFMVNTQQWFRQKNRDKPYIPENFIEIDGIMFKAVDIKQEVLTEQ